MSLIDYVENGSRKGYELKFILCCKMKNGVKWMVGYINLIKFVVCINVIKLDFKNVIVIDFIKWRIW